MRFFLPVRLGRAFAGIVFLLLSAAAGAQSPHTINSFSGSTADFNSAEKWSAGNNVDYYVTYDDNYLYFGAFRTNNNSWGQYDHLNIYLDTDPTSTRTSGGNGSTTGNSWDGATPGLPFQADYHIVIRPNANGESFLNYWNGSAWTNGATNGAGFEQYTSMNANGGLEIRIPRTAIGNPAGIYFTLHGSYNGGTFAGAPAAVSSGNLAQYFGGIGLGSAGCSPTATTNFAIQGDLVNGVPATGVYYGRVLVNTGTVTAANNFGIAPGGSIEVEAGATFNISGRSVGLTPAGSVLPNRSTTVRNDGTLVTTGTFMDIYSDLYITGAGNSTNAQLKFRRALFLPTNFTFASGSILNFSSTAATVNVAPSFAAGSSLYYSVAGVMTRGPEWSATSGAGYPNSVLINNNTILDAGGNGKTATPLQTSGTIQIHSSSSLYMDYGSNEMTVPLVAGGNLDVDGSFSASEAAGGNVEVKGRLALNGTFNMHSRSLTLNGSANQSIIGGVSSASIYDLVLNNATGATLTRNLTVSHDLTITSGKFSVNSGYTLTTNGTAYLNANPSFGSTGTIAMAAGATMQLNTGGWPGSTNAFTWGAGSTLRYAQNGGSYNVGSTDVYWTNTVYPSNIEVGSAGLTLSAARTYPGSLVLNGPLTNSSTLTISNGGTLQLNAGASVVNAVAYSGTSSLIYNTGTATAIGGEWNNTPANITIQGSGTNVSFNVNRSAYNMSISPGATLTTPTANFTVFNLNGNLTVDGTIVANATMQVVGSTNSIISSNVYSSLTLPYITVSKSGGAYVSLNVSVAATGYLNMIAGNLLLNNYDLTVGSGYSGSAASYWKTNGTGRAKTTVGSSAKIFYVGNSTYNPITLTNSGGTSDTYGVRVVDAAPVPAAFVPAKTVQRYWDINEAVSGGSNLSIAAQWNTPSDEGGAFAAGLAGKIGLYNAGWTEKTVSSAAGTGTSTYTTASAFALTGANLTGGLTVAVGKDDAFIQTPPTVAGFTPASGYTGTTITVTGTNFGGTTAVTVGGQNATYTVNSATQLTVSAPASGNGAVAVTTASGSASRAGFTWNAGYATKQAGDYNSAASWLQGAVPPAGADVVINHALTLSAPAANSAASLLINPGGSLDFASGSAALTLTTLTNDGTLSFSGGGTLTLSGTDTLANNGTFTAGSGTVAVTGSTQVGGTGPITFNNVSASGATLAFTGTAAHGIGGTAAIGTLEVNQGSGGLAVSGPVSIGTGLLLTQGALTGAGNITFATGATLQRAAGSLDAAPVFGSTVDVQYTNSSPLVSGAELPATGIVRNLTLQSPGGVSLTRNLQVTGSLALNSGILDLGAFNLTLTAGNSSGGDASSYVRTSGTGALLVKDVSASGAVFPVGNSTYNPLVITSPVTLDWTVRVEDAVANVTSGYTASLARSVSRQWDITPSMNPVDVPGATITFAYNGSTDAGASFSTAQDVVLWHYHNGAWASRGSAHTPVLVDGMQTLTVSGLTYFSPYAIANIGAPLPVSMIAFSGKRVNNRNELKWVTASESSNRGFEVERSLDGRTYVAAGFVASRAAGGNSTSELVYTFNDAPSAGGQAAATGGTGATKWYYRLKQVDLDGRAKYSSVVKLTSEKNELLVVDGVYPNPSKNNIQVRLQAGAASGNVVLQLSDMAGRVVLVKPVMIEAGAATNATINMEQLPAGVYHLKAVAAGGEASEPVKVVKQ